MTKYISNSAEDTERFAERLSASPKGTELIALFGRLGMGKTAFTRGLCRGLGITEGVSSPTFALVNEYRGKFPVYHFDMYRVTSWEDLYSTGFFDYLDNGVLVIEWSENIEGALPEDAVRITISRGEHENQRIFETEGVAINEAIGG